jgi:pimeloyl-ACP methyl ester carboxylesterase
MFRSHPHVRRWSIAVLGAFGVAGAAFDPPSEPAARVPLYDNLGTHAWPISTRSPKAQAYFNQGLRLAWAFNHAEAIRSFAEGERIDSSCAMCAWGIAWASGPNINAAMDSVSAVTAYAAVSRAQRRAAGVSARERAVIAALTARYARRPTAERSALDSAWARAAVATATTFPDDRELQVLAADALMNLSPWDYWTRSGAPRSDTPEILRRLEQVIAEAPSHPGACHLYIHAVEAHSPERALACAERLASLMPGAGHLVHMPGHIYVRVGRYADAIRANEHAVHADESFIRDQQPGLTGYLAAYYPHNYDFLAFASSLLGREEQTIRAAETMAAKVPAAVLATPGMGFAQNHLTRHLQFKVRFAKWQAILDTPAPETTLVYARGIWQYARGRAFVARGDVRGARSALGTLEEVTRSPLRVEFNSADALLGVAVHELDGMIAAAEQRLDDAESLLRTAVEREDALVYGEPPEWSVPVRQDLGALLERRGKDEAAAIVYREDLQRFPANAASAAGLARVTKGARASLLDVPDRFMVAGPLAMRYREVGTGTPIILLHGYTDRVEMWQVMADSLSSTHRVIVPDVRGFGKSTKFARTSDYGRHTVRDLVALMDHLQVPAAHVVGYSMGALMAANLALEVPSRVRTAALVAGPFFSDSAAFARWSAPHVAALKRGHGLTSFFREILPTWPDSLVVAAAQQMTAANDAPALEASLDAMPGWMVDSTKVSRLRMPALAIVGIDDRNLLHGTERIASWWPGARRVVLPKGDHGDIFLLPEVIAEVRRLVGRR